MSYSDSEASLTSSEEDSQSEQDEMSDDEDENVWFRLRDEAIRPYHEQWKESVEHYEQLGNTNEVAKIKARNDLVPTFRNELRQV